MQSTRTAAGIRWIAALVLLGCLTLLTAFIANEIPHTGVTVATNETPTPSAPPAPGAATPSPSPVVAAASATPAPTPTPVPDPRTPNVLPLEELSPEAAQFAQSLNLSGFSAVVLVPAEGIAYELNGSETSPLLSVAKVPIMLALMDKAIDEGRGLTAYEMSLLSAMIQKSDNNAADALWRAIGGEKGMNSFLQSVGLRALETDAYQWGTTLASPMDLAVLVGLLTNREILNEAVRALALDLMGGVVEYQDWGALTGVLVPAQTGIKNGWYPERSGWFLNSVAFVLPADAPGYVIAVLTDGARYLQDGIAAIEQFAMMIHARMAVRG